MTYRILKACVEVIEELAPLQTLDNREELFQRALRKVMIESRGTANPLWVRDTLRAIFLHQDLSYLR